MVDEPDNKGPVHDSDWSRRRTPTIDVEPEYSETRPAPAETLAEGSSGAGAASHPHADYATEAEQPAVNSYSQASSSHASSSTKGYAGPQPASRGVSAWVVGPFSGAVAAVLVIGVGWVLGWPEIQPSGKPPLSTVVEGLSGRIDALEGKVGRTDPAVTGRLDSQDKALALLRAQGDKAATAIAEIRSVPRDSNGAVDIAALTARIDQFEAANKTSAEEATKAAEQASAKANEAAEARAAAEKAAAAAKPVEQKPFDDTVLRRVVAAALLDTAVRHGDAYAAALTAAKALSPNAEGLKALDPFATTGVPSPAALSRDLVGLVPKLSPAPAAEVTTTGSTFVDKLQAEATKLVKIERTTTAATGGASGGDKADRGAVVARVTAAAVRNDVAEARRELKSLAPADRAPAQAWLDKADARDAALAASRQFADDAMTALAKAPQ